MSPNIMIELLIRAGLKLIHVSKGVGVGGGGGVGGWGGGGGGVGVGGGGGGQDVFWVTAYHPKSDHCRKGLIYQLIEAGWRINASIN